MRFSALALLLALTSLAAHAGLTIRGTRVVFDEARGEATVQVQHSKGASPVLMQAWLDDNKADVKPGEQDLPFLVTPAVARMDPGDTQLLRILRTRDGLAQDRETLLHLNILEVPPATQTSGQNTLQLSMQARMKFFYRPKGLPLPVEDAVDRLHFALADAPADGVALQIHNPTPYHIVLSALTLHAHARSPALARFDLAAALGPVIAPFADLRVALKPADKLAPAQVRARLALRGAKPQVHYAVINDQGGHNPKERALEGAL